MTVFSKGFYVRASHCFGRLYNQSFGHRTCRILRFYRYSRWPRFSPMLRIELGGMLRPPRLQGRRIVFGAPDRVVVCLSLSCLVGAPQESGAPTSVTTSIRPDLTIKKAFHNSPLSSDQAAYQAKSHLHTRASTRTRYGSLVALLLRSLRQLPMPYFCLYLY